MLAFILASPLDGLKASELKDLGRHQEEGGVGAGFVLPPPSGPCLGDNAKTYLAL